VDSQQSIANVNQIQLHYEIAGTGDAVVLIHGFGGDLRIWDAQFPVLAQHYRVLRYDIRGHGKSAPPTSEPYAHADDLKALLDHCEISRAHVIGLSMGGEIAINFALAYPERVESLVLVGSSLGGFQWSDEWNASWVPIFTAASTSGKNAVLELVLRHPLIAAAMETPEVAPKLTQILSEYSAWHFLNADPVQHPEPPAVQRLNEIGMPTLIVIGEHDLPDLHAIAELLQQHIPNVTKLDVEGVGHVVSMEAPERLNEIVLSFLAEKLHKSL
jgi:3-oxoadipate enol-lactonase